MKGKTLERLEALVNEAVDAGAPEDEGEVILSGLAKLLDEQVASALGPLQDTVTANVQRILQPVIVERGGERVPAAHLA